MLCLQPLQDVIENLLRRSLSSHIRRQQLALIQVTIDSGVDLSGGILLAQELQHQSDTAQGSDGVRDALAFDIRGTSVARLTNSKAIADIGTGNKTQASNQRSSTIREEITVQIRGNDHIVVLGLAEQLVHHRIDDLLLHLDRGEFLAGQGLARDLTEQAVGLGQYVGLMGDGYHGLSPGSRDGSYVPDLLPAEREFTCNGGNARRSALGDALDRLGYLAIGGLVGPLFLDVKILSVLTDNDQVDGVPASTDSGLDGANVGVEVQLLAEGDDGGGVAGDFGAGGTREVSISYMLN